MKEEELFDIVRPFLGGPPVEAEVDGYRLRISHSDFGDVFVSARKNGRYWIVSYEKDGKWYPITTDTSVDDVLWITSLAARASW